MRVGLFVTCLVDLMRPSIGFAALRLLEAGGAEVYVPPSQTCCGQPTYNSGDRADTIALARKVVEEFEGCDYLVAPSGSCSGMIRTHYDELFADDRAWSARVARFLPVHRCRRTLRASSPPAVCSICSGKAILSSSPVHGLRKRLI